MNHPAPGHDMIEQYLSYLAGYRNDPPNLDRLDADTQERTRTAFALLDDLWLSDADAALPLHDDPLAISLGLVPDPQRPLSGSALRAARRAASIKTNDLAARLRARHWTVSTQDLFAWENAGQAHIAPAIINALAEELHTTPDRLTAATGQTVPSDAAIDEATRSPRFGELVRRWATLTGQTIDAASASLHQTMTLGVARRGAHLTAEEWLDTLEHLLTPTHPDGRQ